MQVSATLVVGVFLAFFAGLARTTGDTLKDPIQDYLHLGDHDQAVELPPFKGLSVLELDVNGDGRPEIFVSADGYGGRLGNIWTVYLARQDGFERLSSPSKDVIFRSDMFYLGEIEMPDGRKVQGLLAYYPGKGGGDLAIYQVANDYMVRTSLGSLNFENQGDRAFWEKYFAGPSEDQPHRSLIDHPSKHLTTKELSERGYDVSAVDQLNAARENDPGSPQTPNTPSAPAVMAASASPTESSPKLPEPIKNSEQHPGDVQRRFWIVAVVILVLGAAGALYFRKRR